MALINEPDLVFLDEPTTGLDVVARTMLLDDLERLKASGTTMVLTTHLMEEAESMSSRILLLDNGKVLKIGSLKEILQECKSNTTLKIVLKKNNSVKARFSEIKKKFSSIDWLFLKDTIYVQGPELDALMNHVMNDKELSESILEINLRKTSLKEAFLFLTRSQDLVEKLNHEKPVNLHS